jgi:hypothetical protein
MTVTINAIDFCGDIFTVSGMRKELWSALLKPVVSHLGKRLTVKRVSGILNQPESLVKKRLIENGYVPHTPRKYRIPDWVLKANWDLPNIAIAQKYKMTRERVRQYRVKLGKPKVESRGRKPNTNGKT